jgi:putative MATE family efflux protein
MQNAKKPAMRVMDMTKGSAMKLILAFAVPLFIGNIFQQVYSMVDTMVAGYNLGDSAIAAIGATSSLYNLMINFAVGLNSGCAVVVTQRFGAKDEKRLRASIAGMMELDAVITALTTLVCLLFLKPLMTFLNTPESIFEEAYSYIVVICAGMCTTVAYNLFSSILRAFGNSRTSLYFLILSSVLNIVLDLLFVAVWHTGVAGAGLATVIAQAVSAALCGVYVYRHYRSLMPSGKEFKVSGELLRELLANGMAMAMMYCVVDLGSIIYQRANNLLGEVIISAHTASRRLISIMNQPASTIATASSTFVGQNWGAGKRSRIRTELKQVMVLQVGISVAEWLIVFLLGDWLVRLTTGTANTEVISNAVMSLRWHVSFFPALGCLIAMRMSMQAMGKKAAPIISSCIELGMKILSAAFLIPAIGFLGTCMTEPIIWTVMFTFLAVAYFVSVRKELMREDARTA